MTASLQNEDAADPHTQDAETKKAASLLEVVSPASPTLLDEDAAADDLWVSPEKSVRWTTVESIRLIMCSVDPRMLPLLVKVGALPEHIDVPYVSRRPVLGGKIRANFCEVWHCPIFYSALQ